MTATAPQPPRSRTQRLSAAFVRTAEPGFYCDGHGLNLRVDPSGARQWVQRLVIRGRPRMLGLGGYPLVSLAEKRKVAFANLQRARTGGDPLAEKRHRATEYALPARLQPGARADPDFAGVRLDPDHRTVFGAQAEPPRRSV